MACGAEAAAMRPSLGQTDCRSTASHRRDLPMNINGDGLRLVNLYDDEYWTNDVETAERSINRMVKADLTSNQFSALVSLLVSISLTEFRRSDLLRFINRGLFFDAAKEFENYIIVDNDEDKILKKRRTLEKALFLKPELVPKKAP